MSYVIWRKIHSELYDKLESKMRDLSVGKDVIENSIILGLCLNVLGLVVYDCTKDCEASPRAAEFHSKLLDWMYKNYLPLKKNQPYAAELLITGRISFDEQNNRLIQREELNIVATLSLSVAI